MSIVIAYSKHILWLKVCERSRTVLTVLLKSILSNIYLSQPRGWPSSWKRENPDSAPIFRMTSTFSAVVYRRILKIDFKTVNTMLSQTFNLKMCFEYAIYIVSSQCLGGFFLTLNSVLTFCCWLLPLPEEHKMHIFELPCNVLFIIWTIKLHVDGVLINWVFKTAWPIYFLENTNEKYTNVKIV